MKISLKWYNYYVPSCYAHTATAKKPKLVGESSTVQVAVKKHCR